MPVVGSAASHVARKEDATLGWIVTCELEDIRSHPHLIFRLFAENIRKIIVPRIPAPETSGIKELPLMRLATSRNFPSVAYFA